jgi:hypothetical protein
MGYLVRGKAIPYPQEMGETEWNHLEEYLDVCVIIKGNLIHAYLGYDIVHIQKRRTGIGYSNIAR